MSAMLLAGFGGEMCGSWLLTTTLMLLAGFAEASGSGGAAQAVSTATRGAGGAGVEETCCSPPSFETAAVAMAATVSARLWLLTATLVSLAGFAEALGTRGPASLRVDSFEGTCCSSPSFEKRAGRANAAVPIAATVSASSWLLTATLALLAGFAAF